MFGRKLEKEVNYRLVSLFIRDYIHSAAYFNGADGEFITDLISGERFYSIEDFLRSQYGLRSFNPDYDFIIFDEDEEIWAPLYMFVVSD